MYEGAGALRVRVPPSGRYEFWRKANALIGEDHLRQILDLHYYCYWWNREKIPGLTVLEASVERNTRTGTCTVELHFNSREVSQALQSGASHHQLRRKGWEDLRIIARWIAENSHRSILGVHVYGPRDLIVLTGLTLYPPQPLLPWWQWRRYKRESVAYLALLSAELHLILFDPKGVELLREEGVKLGEAGLSKEEFLKKFLRQGRS